MHRQIGDCLEGTYIRLLSKILLGVERVRLHHRGEVSSLSYLQTRQYRFCECGYIYPFQPGMPSGPIIQIEAVNVECSAHRTRHVFDKGKAAPEGAACTLSPKIEGGYES